MPSKGDLRTRKCLRKLYSMFIAMNVIHFSCLGLITYVGFSFVPIQLLLTLKNLLMIPCLELELFDRNKFRHKTNKLYTGFARTRSANHKITQIKLLAWIKNYDNGQATLFIKGLCIYSFDHSWFLKKGKKHILA